MILYLDTSDLVKLYVTEDDWMRVHSNVATAARLASCTLTYPEMRATLARAFRGNRIIREGTPVTEFVYRQLINDFERDWRLYIKVSLTQRLMQTAGGLAEAHFLSGSDAVQLAAALSLRDITLDEVQLSIADSDLKRAAITEGFVVV